MRMLRPLRTIRVIKSAYAVVQDPTDLDSVIRMVNAVRDSADLSAIVSVLKRDPAVAESFRSRPNLDAVRGVGPDLPSGSLGREFHEFLDRHGISRDVVPTIDVTDEGQFFRSHIYETHDVWHLVTGFEPTIAGEMAVQAFYLAQMPSRVAVLILALALLNTLVYGFEDHRARMEAVVEGWQLGKQARPLFGQDWASHWRRPLADVRAELGLGPQAGAGLRAGL